MDFKFALWDLHYGQINSVDLSHANNPVTHLRIADDYRSGRWSILTGGLTEWLANDNWMLPTTDMNTEWGKQQRLKLQGLELIAFIRLTWAELAISNAANASTDGALDYSAALDESGQ